MSKKELLVSALENGTVIDHIAPNQVMRVLRILNLEHCENMIYLGINLSSQKYGKKGIIKVADRFFKEEEINKIALVSPQATTIEIKNFEVVKKGQVALPKEIHGSVKCMNPNCVTNHQPVETWFAVTDTQGIKLKCHYCEKNNLPEVIEFL